MLINISKLFIVSYLTIINSYLVNTFDEKQFGYYAFDKSSRNEFPPRIRPPPYIQSNLQCPGVVNVRHLDDGKDTLCGDLKRGILPQNPMNILIHGQHYPFELIKNKTLHFLARSLPYLKEDHENIPKVFKISQTGNELYSNLDTLNQPMINRVKRQAKATVTKVDKSELNDTLSANNLTSPSSKNYRTVNDEESNQQMGCDKKDGILCHIIQALTSRQNSKSSESNGGLFNTISSYYNAYKAAQSFSNFVSNLDKSDNEKTSNDPYSNYMAMLSQILNPANAQPATTTPPSSSTTSNNALNAFLEYFNGGNSNNGGLSLLGRKKKNPVEMDEYMNGLAAASSMQSPTIAKTEEQIQMGQLTPTACPSIEEYISPVYAKNHLGIWKYIVQVPHEGYFTQTIQKTSCVKNKCDYMDGMCKEANRWVSLLVAEVYYPNSKKPLSNMLPQQSQLKPTIYNSLNTMQNLNNKLNSQSNVFSNGDTNAINYELLNSLLPQQNFNEYNHYSNDQFARRASKNHQPISPAVPVTPKSSASTFGFPSTSYSLPQFQEANQYQTYQPNYNQLANQVVNNQHNPIKSNQAFNTNQQTKAFEQLIDIYNQHYLKQQQQQQQQSQFQQLSKPINNNNNNNAAAAYSLIDSLTAASMMYPATVVSQSSGQTNLNQPMIQPIQAQNLKQLNNKQNEQMIKPRSFDTMSNHDMMESTLMKQGYLGNNEEIAAASTDDKTISNEQNSNNQPANVNNSNLNNQAQSNQNEQNDNSSRENTINSNNNNEECDGYDNNGCYIIRVYYDWFLVSGSCKCWRPNTKTGSSFETLKKLIVGK